MKIGGIKVGHEKLGSLEGEKKREDNYDAWKSSD